MSNLPVASRVLDGFSDLQLRRLTMLYCQRLEDATAEVACAVAFSLYAKTVISKLEYEQITGADGDKASQLLLKTVLSKEDAKAARAMWQSFTDFRENNAFLKVKRILQEIDDKGDSLHKEINWAPDEVIQDCLVAIHRQHQAILKERNATLALTSFHGWTLEKTFPLDKHFTELLIIPSLRYQEQVQHELLARGREHVEWRKQTLRRELEKVRHHEIFGTSFGKCTRCLYAVISGVAGIGKTTLVQKIVHDWAVGKIYGQFHFLFQFKFRELNIYQDRTSLKQIILDSYPYLEKDLKKVLANTNRILLIFDGLDEFREPIIFPDIQAKSPNSQSKGASHLYPESWCSIPDIIRALFQGQMLPDCSVLVTTRPTALESLQMAPVHLYAEILGFSDAQIKDYFLKFNSDTKVSLEMLTYVEDNAILYTMCYNPSYCWVICSSLEATFTSPRVRDWSPPKTITQLYANYIHNILKNHSREAEEPRQLLLKTGEMAYMGVAEKVIVFGDHHFHRYGLQPSNFLSGFLMQILQKENSLKDVVYSFFHLTVQEFLAALAKFFQTPTPKLSQLLDETSTSRDGRYEIFLQFMAGLSCPATTAQLKDLIGEVPQGNVCKVVDWIKERFESAQGHKIQLLNTLHYLFEAQNKALVQETMGQVRQVDFSFQVMSPVDCYVLAVVLGPCQQLQNLHLFNCSIESWGMKSLKSVLHKCVTVRLSQNRLGDQGVKLLCEALRKPDCQMQTLELWMVNLTDGCVEDLASALSTNVSIRDLNLRDNAFTDHSVPTFLHLVENCSGLLTIDLCNNPFSGVGCQKLKLFEEKLRRTRHGLKIKV
ncbi:NACHT, LRR and PYD domains-containing protein 3 isoform X2 [Microcaecilia unicolor]|uniref:NACHT, LRR and PYD domains-containing protein 3-like isoform X2 n=1 Tax=Microcaecilia unicolor TaxID=1415580 RepID=A0A6P7WIV5_9AMPH|nr:NACHT, LRR and PYD domains-containing protein 3-like isoform X2 [Microcaecilia unicolor]XP_030043238.1 NACHT, LRR and PYD domains-containing protein 3-like isoform X2 [Microcaecilia unicolor]